MYYEPVGRAFVRIPLLPMQDAFELVDAIEKESAHAVLAKGDDTLTEVILSASPSLEQQLRSQKGETSKKESVWSKQDHAFAKYVLRAGGRPTPFAELAGIAPLQLSDHTDIELDDVDKYVRKSRADYEYVQHVARKLETKAYRALRFVTNPACRSKWQRLELLVTGNQPKASVRNTVLVQAVLRHARTPRSWGDLVQLICEMYPGTDLEKAETPLKTLVEHEFLLADIRPTVYTADPLDSLLKSALDASTEVDSELNDELSRAKELHRLLSEVSTTPIGRAVQLLRQAFSLSDPDTSGPQRRVATDMAVALRSNRLSQQIAQSCDEAARLLFRISPWPRRHPWIVDYHRRFVERYTYEEIPLLDLIDKTTGLGLPEGYSSLAQRMEQTEAARIREQVLLDIAGRALHEGTREIQLDESIIKKLEIEPEWEAWLPNSLDLFVQIGGSAVGKMDSEDFRIIIAPRVGDSPAWRSIGRFCHVLPPEITDELRLHAKWEEEMNPDVIFCDLAYIHTSGHASNVALRPRAYTYELLINHQPTRREDHTILLEDILVGAWRDGFYLRDKNSGKRILVRSMHLLNPYTAPDVCRFLHDVSEDGVSKLAPFDWGAARSLPYLPRVAYGNIVLSLARWRLCSELMSESKFDSWKIGFAKWRNNWSVPRYVFLVDEGDMYIPLDLERTSHLRLLHRHAISKRGGQKGVILKENLESFCAVDRLGRKFAAEFVIPLRAVHPRSERSCVEENISIIDRADISKPPASEWLYFKLYGDEEYQDDLLIDFKQAAQEGIEEAGCKWFFVRYSDPVPHIRLRIYGEPELLTKEIFHRMASWARNCFSAGLVSKVMLDTYDREVRRYGGPRILRLCEELFHLDSTIITHIIECQRFRKTFEDKVILGVISVHFFLTSLGFSKEEISRFLSTAQDDPEGRYSRRDSGNAFRKRREAILKPLLDGTVQQVLGVPDHLVLRMRQVRDWFSAEPDGTMQRLLGSLTHMHLNRLGVDTRDEARVYHHLGRAYDALRHVAPMEAR
ncbi:lantibiotic dehydratase [Alicyclobacillus sendaiensis]|uniref:lantibiotic dehydratase n=1 Tax=Alicyclobacillus sendaiensis TaxID=192387 RepID=UPI0026F4114D|nr:lantibiotic dehydratase [Alicyclobacillus sendaiensis]